MFFVGASLLAKAMYKLEQVLENPGFFASKLAPTGRSCGT